MHSDTAPSLRLGGCLQEAQKIVAGAGVRVGLRDQPLRGWGTWEEDLSRWERPF